VSLSKWIPLHEDILNTSSDASGLSIVDFLVERGLNFFFVGVPDKIVREGPVGDMIILIKMRLRSIWKLDGFGQVQLLFLKRWPIFIDLFSELGNLG